MCVVVVATRYEVDLLKDKYEDIEENHLEMQRLHRDRCKVHFNESHSSIIVTLLLGTLGRVHTGIAPVHVL